MGFLHTLLLLAVPPLQVLLRPFPLSEAPQTEKKSEFKGKENKVRVFAKQTNKSRGTRVRESISSSCPLINLHRTVSFIFVISKFRTEKLNMRLPTQLCHSSRIPHYQFKLYHLE